MTVITRTEFIGRWRLIRQIDDRLSGVPGEMFGYVDLSEHGTHGLQYDETGQLRLGQGVPVQASRRYFWLFDPDGGANSSDVGIAVSFSDGRPFHSFVPQGKAPGTDHPCGADFYRVAYDFTLWPQWTATWTVSGPRKDYTMISQYEPA